MTRRLQFFPQLIVAKKDEAIGLRTVDQAIEFLQNWPRSARDDKWVAALRCTEFARDGLMSAQSARRSVENWAKSRGLMSSSRVGTVSGAISSN